VLLALCPAIGEPRAPSANEVNVVVSIKPVHSLVAGVMQGVGEPVLLVKGTGSEHS
jgi:zinc transport system substrate-binding protein